MESVDLRSKNSFGVALKMIWKLLIEKADHSVLWVHQREHNSRMCANFNGCQQNGQKCNCALRSQSLNLFGIFANGMASLVKRMWKPFTELNGLHNAVKEHSLRGIQIFIAMAIARIVMVL